MELDVRQNSRSAITLAALTVVFLAGVSWAWASVTEPFPERETAAPCTETLVARGDELAPPQVLVNVLNGGGGNGLAATTMSRLVGFGFAQGSTGNAPSDLGSVRAQVWTDDPGDPAAILLASYLGKGVELVDQPSGYAGMTVVVGKRFQGVKKGRAVVTAQKDSTVCVPPLSSTPDDLS